MTSEPQSTLATVETALAGLCRQFADSLPTRIEAIRAQFSYIDSAGWQSTEVQALHHLVHALTGAAGTFGMHSVSAVARELEQHMAARLQDGQEFSSAHRQEAANILKRLEELAQVIALTHHEKWDGSGYPHGLTGTAIPQPGRIVAVADVFDALIFARPYKNAWPVDKAVVYLQDNVGKHFDPEVMTHFLQNLPEIVAISDHYAEPEVVCI